MKKGVHIPDFCGQKYRGHYRLYLIPKFRLHLPCIFEIEGGTLEIASLQNPKTKNFL